MKKTENLIISHRGLINKGVNVVFLDDGSNTSIESVQLGKNLDFH